MRAMNALGRITVCLQFSWAARGAGITGTAAAFFIPHNNYYDLRSAVSCRYS